MLENNSYDCINSILQEFDEEGQTVNTHKLKDHNFVDVLLIMSDIVDKNSSCSKCLKIKNKILGLSGKIKDILKNPKKNVGYQKEYNNIINDFLEHFFLIHDNVKEILIKNYNISYYYYLKVYNELKTRKGKRKLKKIYKRYSEYYLKLSFFWIEERFNKEEKRYKKLKVKSINFIFNLFRNKKIKKLESDYLEFVKEIAGIVGEDRQNFIKRGEESYKLYYDINLRIKGLEIIEKEKKRKKRNKFLNILYQKVDKYNNNKHLDELIRMANNIESLISECKDCNQLKEKMSFLLDELDQFKTEDKKIKFKEIYKKQCEFIKESKKHFKKDHNKFDIKSFDKKVVTPLVILMLLLLRFFPEFVTEIYDFNLPQHILSKLIFVSLILFIVILFNLKRIKIKIFSLIHKFKDVF